MTIPTRILAKKREEINVRAMSHKEIFIYGQG